MTAVYVGDGSNAYEALPVHASTTYNSNPLVVPVTHLATTVFPNWDSICTYGYNLPVNDYRGRFTDIGTTPFDGGTGQSCTIPGGKSLSASGLSGCKTSTTIADLYPTFSSLNSAKQKIRGRLYSAYDDYLGVAAITKNESSWPSGSSLSSNPMYAYRKTSSNEQLWIKGGWIILQFTGDVTDSSVGLCQCDAVWTSSTSATPQWTLSSGRMVLSSSDLVATSTFTIPFAVRSFSGGYVIVRLGSCMVGKGNILMSAPRIRVSHVARTLTVNLIQFGITFGTADS